MKKWRKRGKEIEFCQRDKNRGKIKRQRKGTKKRGMSKRVDKGKVGG